MVSQIINVVVNSRGAVTVARELDAIGASAKSTATYLNGLRGILAAALTFSGAGQIVETINTFQALQNRLKQVADANTSVSDTWERLLAIANSSYSSIGNTVDLYFRVVQAYKAWGQGAKEAAEFTDLFQKAAQLSGSTVQTTSQAVYQFGQALNKGKLDGDEFRSVLEGLPYVANIIQKSLGVTRAELYRLSKEGKISVDAIKDAFENSAKTIRADWANITPTIGMALTVLDNSWTEFVGNIQNSTGVFSLVADLILLIAQHFTLLAIALSPVAVSLGFLAGRLGLGLVVTGFKDLTTALKEATVVQWLFNAAVTANPYVIAAAAIAAVIGLLLYFTGALSGITTMFSTLWSAAVTAFTAIYQYLVNVITAMDSVLQISTTWNAAWVVLKSVANAALNGIISLVGSAISAVGTFVEYIGKALAPLFSSLTTLASQFFGLLTDIIGLFAKELAPAIDLVEVAFRAFWEYAGPSLVTLGGYLSDILKGWKNIGIFLSNNFLPGVKAVFEGWLFLIDSVVRGLSSIINFLRQAIALFQQMASLGGGGGGGGGAHYGAQFQAEKGFATGGAFKVGGDGAGRDTTPVSFRAERGERVTVETKKQQRANDNAQQAVNVNVPVTNVTVFDPNMMVDAMYSAKGQQTHLNVIKSNVSEIRNILGIV